MAYSYTPNRPTYKRKTSEIRYALKRGTYVGPNTPSPTLIVN